VRVSCQHTGRVRAARVEILAEVGAYPHNGLDKPEFAAFMAVGPYDIADVEVSTTTVVTNRAPTGSYRGAGRPEAAYAMERAIEAFGRAAGLDGAAVRRANLIRPEQMPYRTATGACYDSGDYPAALAEALRAVDAAAVRAQQRARRERGGHPLGLGVAVFVERAGGAPHSGEYARVEVDSAGMVVARVGTAAAGQGHETTWAQITAAALGVAPTQVRVVAGDTAAVARGTGTFASRGVQIAGSALHRTATGLAALLADHDRGEGLAAAAARVRAAGVEPAVEEDYSPGAQTFPYGAVAAVVEVDRGTGALRLLRLAAVDDCGTVVNPLLAEGQAHGSLAQGVAQALFEEVAYDESGQLRSATLMDYLVPAAPDLPDFETRRMTTPAPSNPLGAKGAGESGCIGAPPAVVLAVLDALAPDGVTDLDMPLTPERVWRALRAVQDVPR
jgi:aerobic carbon-monoxide dehydrogenase large subunit